MEKRPTVENGCEGRAESRGQPWQPVQRGDNWDGTCGKAISGQLVSIGLFCRIIGLFCRILGSLLPYHRALLPYTRALLKERGDHWGGT